MKVLSFFFWTSSILSVIFTSGVTSRTHSSSSGHKVLWQLSGNLENNKKRISSIERWASQDLAELESKFVFDFPVEIGKSLKEGDVVQFDLPSETHNKKTKESVEIKAESCVLKRGIAAVPEALALKVPNLKLFTCHSIGKFNGNALMGSMTLVIDTSDNRLDGMSATIQTVTPNGIKNYYIESAVDHSDIYVAINVQDAASEGVFHKYLVPEDPPEYLSEHVDELIHKNDYLKLSRRSKQQRSSAYRLKFGMLIGKSFTESFGGGSLSNVLGDLAQMLTRLNGVMTNDLGIYFELIDDQDKLVCFDSSPPGGCDIVESTDSLNAIGPAMADLGVDITSMALGHFIISTSGGGSAQVGAFCSNGGSGNSRARAVSGVTFGLSFFPVSTLAHEIGHQLRSGHSWRHCPPYQDPQSGQFMHDWAVEPGSGSTIMSYSGFCGNTNLGSDEAYFTSRSIQTMLDHISGGISRCGAAAEEIEMNFDRPVVSSPESCVIPIGNPFSLVAGTTTPRSTTTFFTWERVDVGFEDFDNVNLGKFRTYMPVASRARFFPNLHFLNFGIDTRVENLPRVERSMVFRALERRLFEEDVVNNGVPNFGLNNLGDVVFTDSSVEFRDVGALEVTAPLQSETLVLDQGTGVPIRWNPRSTAGLVPSGKVQILFAENTMSDTSFFSYIRDNKELNWIVLGETDINAGEACVSLGSVQDYGLSESDTSALDSFRGNLMVRASADQDPNATIADIATEGGCFFFSLVTNIRITLNSSEVETCALNVIPTPEPTIDLTPTGETVPVNPRGINRIAIFTSLFVVISMLILGALFFIRKRRKSRNISNHSNELGSDDFLTEIGVSNKKRSSSSYHLSNSAPTSLRASMKRTENGVVAEEEILLSTRWKNRFQNGFVSFKSFSGKSFATSKRIMSAGFNRLKKARNKDEAEDTEGEIGQIDVLASSSLKQTSDTDKNEQSRRRNFFSGLFSKLGKYEGKTVQSDMEADIEHNVQDETISDNNVENFAEEKGHSLHLNQNAKASIAQNTAKEGTTGLAKTPVESRVSVSKLRAMFESGGPEKKEDLNL